MRIRLNEIELKLKGEEKAIRKRNIVINGMEVESDSRKEKVEKQINEIRAQVREDAVKLLGETQKEKQVCL